MLVCTGLGSETPQPRLGSQPSFFSTLVSLYFQPLTNQGSGKGALVLKTVMLRECYSFGAVWEIEAAVFFLSIFGSFQPCTLYLSHVISYDTKLMAFTKLPALGERSQFLSHAWRISLLLDIPVRALSSRMS